MSENLSKLAEVSREGVSAAIGRLADKGFLNNPASEAAQSYILDELPDKMPGLWFATQTLGSTLRQEPLGWKDEDVAIVQSGFDMALMVIQELIDQSESR